MSEDYTRLTPLQLDALREVVNIGAGNAATALAAMVQARVDMAVPRVELLPFERVADLLGGPEVPVACVFLYLSGEAPARILFALEVERALQMVDVLMQREPGTTVALDEMGVSALQELGNILASAYGNALAELTGLVFLPSVPAFALDMAGAILDAVLAQYGEVSDQALVMETCFAAAGLDVIGLLFMLPDPGALDRILQALEVSAP